MKLATPPATGTVVVPESVAPGVPVPGTSEAETEPAEQPRRLPPSSETRNTGCGEKAVPEAAHDPTFSDDERLAMRYAAAITRTVSVPDALFGEIRKRFSPTEIVELTAAIATYNMVARFLMPLEIPKE